MGHTFLARVKNEKGLTLIELLAVIVILGIIAAIAVPSIGKIIENSRIKAAKSEAIIAIDAAKLYFAEHQFYVDWQSANLTDLIAGGYMNDNGYLNDTSYIKNSSPPEICARDEKKSKVTFYFATAEEIAKSRNELHIGTKACGSPLMTPPE